MGKCADLIGQKFGRLTVLERDGSNRFGHAMWLCKCDCGELWRTSTSKLRDGDAKSCGCLYKTKATTHGLSRKDGKITKLYKAWVGMKSRCYNETDLEHWKNYGGRGIKVCEEWIKDYKAFHDWAIANGYCENLTLDRINVNGNYEPNNCRWITNKEQQNNKRTNRWITYNNETHNITQWAKLYNISPSQLRNRLKLGWDFYKALTMPVRKTERRRGFCG